MHFWDVLNRAASLTAGLSFEKILNVVMTYIGICHGFAVYNINHWWELLTLHD